jgi:ABC-type transport system involved in cytochrome bd biosynthesis fused ATPase/permease subunit
VTLGGRDLCDYRQEDVRRMFALAGQEAHIFNSTIRANLLVGRPEADDGELWQALRHARLEDWASSLPEGLDTLVGENGNRLSGGQRQRLTVGRALLSDAPILVLDEPTAHLDPPTAQALVGDALAAAGDRSVLLITHRTEGLELVDEVIAMA